MQRTTDGDTIRGRFDGATVAAIAAMAYVVATALHEHAGHALACQALGGHVRAFGAFYVDCDGSGMPASGVRLVALAGPAMSLLLGLAGGWLLRGRRSPWVALFLWLLASIGLMTGLGYPVFSAVSGLGDFGVGPDGALHGVAAPWLWRLAMGVVGYGLYDRAVVWSIRRLAVLTGGGDFQRQRVRRIALLCYLAGGVTSVLIGLFNPEGLVIVLTSAAAASLGGTSGLAWGPYRTQLPAIDARPAATWPRSWGWIVVGVVVVLAYAVWLGPTLPN